MEKQKEKTNLIYNYLPRNTVKSIALFLIGVCLAREMKGVTFISPC